jgi:hypothetical protein
MMCSRKILLAILKRHCGEWLDLLPNIAKFDKIFVSVQPSFATLSEGVCRSGLLTVIIADAYAKNLSEKLIL